MFSVQTIYSSLAVVELIKCCQFKQFEFRISRINKKVSVQNLFKSHSSVAKKKLSKNCQS